MAKKLNIEEATKTLALLAQEFPECFTLSTPQPLKIDIKKDILDVWGDKPKFSRTKLQQALYMYTNSAAYLNAFRVEPVRVDLQGNPVEDVLESDRAHSKEKYFARYGKKKKESRPQRPFSNGRSSDEKPFFSKSGANGASDSTSPFGEVPPQKDLSKVEIVKKPVRRKSALLKKSLL